MIFVTPWGTFTAYSLSADALRSGSSTSPCSGKPAFGDVRDATDIAPIAGSPLRREPHIDQIYSEFLHQLTLLAGEATSRSARNVSLRENLNESRDVRLYFPRCRRQGWPECRSKLRSAATMSFCICFRDRNCYPPASRAGRGPGLARAQPRWTPSALLHRG
jgi:hypothetical protein